MNWKEGDGKLNIMSDKGIRRKYYYNSIEYIK